MDKAKYGNNSEISDFNKFFINIEKGKVYQIEEKTIPKAYLKYEMFKKLKYDKKLNIPYYDIKDRKGVTDYIDFLSFEEIPYPVMQGRDCFKRLFFIVKFIRIIIYTFKS